MDKLKEELKRINNGLVKIIVGKVVEEKQSGEEKKLWTQKRKILADLNPFNI